MGRRESQDNKSRLSESEDDMFRVPGHLVEKPVSSGDATGAPTYKRGDTHRYDRELAHQAWLYLARHNKDDRLPDWVVDYLQLVAGKVLENLGPKGALAPAFAQEAIGLVGQQWPEHHPEKVFMIMQRWIDGDATAPPISRKAAAVRYIVEYMGDDGSIKWKYVVHRYKEGKKRAKQL